MPEDDDEDYEEDAGEEMVDMEDDEAHENDQLQANKVGGTALMDDEDDENVDQNMPVLANKKFQGQTSGGSDLANQIGANGNNAAIYSSASDAA